MRTEELYIKCINAMESFLAKCIFGARPEYEANAKSKYLEGTVSSIDVYRIDAAKLRLSRTQLAELCHLVDRYNGELPPEHVFQVVMTSDGMYLRLNVHDKVAAKPFMPTDVELHDETGKE